MTVIDQAQLDADSCDHCAALLVLADQQQQLLATVQAQVAALQPVIELLPLLQRPGTQRLLSMFGR